MSEQLNAFQLAALRELKIDGLYYMQMSSLAHCRKNDSMVILSTTGTGMSLAFLLPLLERLDVSCSKVQAVVVLPSRE